MGGFLPSRVRRLRPFPEFEIWGYGITVTFKGNIATTDAAGEKVGNKNETYRKVITR